MKHYLFAILFLLGLFLGGYTNKHVSAEISSNEAIKIASSFAANQKYNLSNIDTEIIKYKTGVEKGPIRLVWLAMQFPKDKVKELANRDFWLVYFYPKGQLTKGNTLGGDFCTLIDIHSGEIVGYIAGR